MGLLDDAIREHLDLKRRRGADPSELHRQEQEALGPARRVDDGGRGGGADDTVVATAAAPIAEEDRGGAISLDRIDDDVEWDEPVRPSAGAVSASAAPSEPDAGASDEDVLEETPEFLEDTPEHDRLWFEQRPPRDFDFDG